MVVVVVKVMVVAAMVWCDVGLRGILTFFTFLLISEYRSCFSCSISYCFLFSPRQAHPRDMNR